MQTVAYMNLWWSHGHANTWRASASEESHSFQERQTDVYGLIYCRLISERSVRIHVERFRWKVFGHNQCMYGTFFIFILYNNTLHYWHFTQPSSLTWSQNLQFCVFYYSNVLFTSPLLIMHTEGYTSTLQVHGSWITLGVYSDHWASTMLSPSSGVWQRAYSRSRASLNTLNNISSLAKANGYWNSYGSTDLKRSSFIQLWNHGANIACPLLSSWYYYMSELFHLTLFCIRLPHIFFRPLIANLYKDI